MLTFAIIFLVVCPIAGHFWLRWAFGPQEKFSFLQKSFIGAWTPLLLLVTLWEKRKGNDSLRG